jgi:hypothetical protein
MILPGLEMNPKKEDLLKGIGGELWNAEFVVRNRN